MPLKKKGKKSACASSLRLTTKYQKLTAMRLPLIIKPNTNKNKENVTCWPGIGRGRWLTPPPDGPPFFFASPDDL